MASIGKKFINNVQDCVDENLAGFVAINTGLRLIPEHRIVFREDLEEVISQGLVGLLSGGGAGHEPAFAGYVGPGMLSAAVSGSVFASPPVSNILVAIRLLARGNPGGVLLIIMNYTGDRLNFGQAEEMAKAEGLNVKSYLVADDCALTSGDASVGRRGLSAGIFIMKIAGALSQRGHSLPEILDILNELSPNVGTIGLSLTPCTLPGSGPNFILGPNEMELGLGIHGEAGVARIKLRSAQEAVTIMLGHMTNPESFTSLKLDRKSPIAVIVNNLGGTSHLEMNIVALQIVNWLEQRGYQVARIYSGSLLTSLEMAGIMITILQVINPQILEYLDDPTGVVSWPRNYNSQRKVVTRSNHSEVSIKNLTLGGVENVMIESDKISSENATAFKSCIENSCQALISNKELLNDLDSGCGDGDCGTTLSTGAQEILKQLAQGLVDLLNPYSAFLRIANICQNSMGGVSGALYSIFFTAAATVLRKDIEVKKTLLALNQGISAISKHGGAKIGDRTMLDALHAASSTLEKALHEISSSHLKDFANAFAKSASGAELAADATRNLSARAGRASYVNPDLTKGKCDAGAQAVAIIFRAIADTLTSIV